MSKSNTATDFLSIEESEKQFNPTTLDLFDHIAEILAEEYVRAIKEEDKDNESSHLC